MLCVSVSGALNVFYGGHKLSTLISFYMPSSCAIFFFFLFNLTPPPSLCLSVSPLPAGRQPARSFTLSDSVMHPQGQSLDDVIWTKGCVNTALTLVLDLSIGLGFENREEDCVGLRATCPGCDSWKSRAD